MSRILTKEQWGKMVLKGSLSTEEREALLESHELLRQQEAQARLSGLERAAEIADIFVKENELFATDAAKKCNREHYKIQAATSKAIAAAIWAEGRRE